MPDSDPIRLPLAVLQVDRLRYVPVNPPANYPELIGRFSARIGRLVHLTWPIFVDEQGRTRLGHLPDDPEMPHVPGFTYEMPMGGLVLVRALLHALKCPHARIGKCTWPGPDADGSCDGSGRDPLTGEPC